jgi:hypothetical protein
MKLWVKIFSAILFGGLGIGFRQEDWIWGTIVCFILSAAFTLYMLVPSNNTANHKENK